MKSAKLTLCVTLAACIAATTTALSVENWVPATADYREAYGPPPKTQATSCLAAVVYLPGVGRSGRNDRLSALPIFSLSPDKVVEEVARVVVEGYPVRARLFETFELFPVGTKMLGVAVEGGVAIVRVSRGLPGEGHPLAKQALSHTLAQFDRVDSVRFALEGAATTDLPPPQADLLESPAPPRLLDVVSSVHAGEPLEEVDVLFDRPIDVESFTITLDDGTGIPARTYTSMFDMAVVYRPEDPKVLREGLPLKIAWAVKDKTGRPASGQRTVALRVYKQPE